jgi:hypothetical protein
MSYFYALGFLGLLSLCSIFGGLPTLFLHLIASSVSGGYRASCVRAFIPALCIRRSIVLCATPSSSAISVSVQPVIAFIIGILSDFVNSLNHQTITIQMLGGFSGKLL